MRKAERGFGSGRIVWIAVVGSLAVALAGCGDDESGSSGTVSTTSSTSTTSPPTVADTAPATTTTPPTGGTTPPPTGGTTPPPTGGTTPPPGGGTTTSSSSVTLGWVAPTQNSNGTPITGLSGYKIHYGTASQDYTQVVSLANPSLSRYVLDSLQSGTYYFAITAYNAQGIESPLSGEISTTLN
jgi:Fibronectin type III domain